MRHWACDVVLVYPVELEVRCQPLLLRGAPNRHMLGICMLQIAISCDVLGITTGHFLSVSLQCYAISHYLLLHLCYLHLCTLCTLYSANNANNANQTIISALSLSFHYSFQHLMSLYFDAVSVLTSPSSAGGSFKSRIYSSRNLKANPAQIYALVTEASKWDTLLKEVIENAGILNLEPKVRVKLLQHLESRPAD
jgi:hypothetical protein